ncbi:MAG: DUF4271 domain-containing protein [Flavobacteriales bacterium]|nr:DUF4271 domain-containing protein [Flavobacteriales bacterium]
MDLIAEAYNSPNQEWVFILFIFFFSYITFLKYNYFSRFVLILKSPFSQKHANQFLREESRSSNKLYLLPLFAAFLSMYVVAQSFSMVSFIFHFSWIISFLFFKYLFLVWLAYIFQKKYQFEEIIFQSFLYERVAAIVIFPLLLLLFYTSIPQNLVLNFIYIFLVSFTIYKIVRMAYLSFFNSSFSKAHIIIYLCTLEILPLIILSKYLC